jgi:hypothetical protein
MRLLDGRVVVATGAGRGSNWLTRHKSEIPLD